MRRILDVQATHDFIHIDENRFHNKWIYDNRYALSPFFINVTHSVLQTINALIGFIDFCEANNYPYFIFDGLNKCIPEKTKTGWGLVGKIELDCHPVSVAENVKSDYEFFKDKTGEPIIHKSIIDYINSIPNYFKEISLKQFLLSNGELEHDNIEYYGAFMRKILDIISINNNNISYTDCMEFSLLRFIQLLLYDPPNIEKNGFSSNPAGDLEFSSFLSQKNKMIISNITGYCYSNIIRRGSKRYSCQWACIGYSCYRGCAWE